MTTTFKPLHSYQKKYLYDFGAIEYRTQALLLDLLQFLAMPFPSTVTLNKILSLSEPLCSIVCKTDECED